MIKKFSNKIKQLRRYGVGLLLLALVCAPASARGASKINDMSDVGWWVTEALKPAFFGPLSFVGNFLGGLFGVGGISLADLDRKIDALEVSLSDKIKKGVSEVNNNTDQNAGALFAALFTSDTSPNLMHLVKDCERSMRIWAAANTTIQKSKFNPSASNDDYDDKLSNLGEIDALLNRIRSAREYPNPGSGMRCWTIQIYSLAAIYHLKLQEEALFYKYVRGVQDAELKSSVQDIRNAAGEHWVFMQKMMDDIHFEQKCEIKSDKISLDVYPQSRFKVTGPRGSGHYYYRVDTPYSGTYTVTYQRWRKKFDGTYREAGTFDVAFPWKGTIADRSEHDEWKRGNQNQQTLKEEFLRDEIEGRQKDYMKRRQDVVNNNNYVANQPRQGYWKNNLNSRQILCELMGIRNSGDDDAIDQAVESLEKARDEFGYWEKVDYAVARQDHNLRFNRCANLPTYLINWFPHWKNRSFLINDDKTIDVNSPKLSSTYMTLVETDPQTQYPQASDRLVARDDTSTNGSKVVLMNRPLTTRGEGFYIRNARSELFHSTSLTFTKDSTVSRDSPFRVVSTWAMVKYTYTP